jgi:molybdenum cofactor cytidylyltransferase
VFSAAAFPALRELHGDKAVWKLIERHPDRIGRIAVDRELPRDVDTWEDYEAALSAARVAG